MSTLRVPTLRHVHLSLGLPFVAVLIQGSASAALKLVFLRRGLLAVTQGGRPKAEEWNALIGLREHPRTCMLFTVSRKGSQPSRHAVRVSLG